MRHVLAHSEQESAGVCPQSVFKRRKQSIWTSQLVSDGLQSPALAWGWASSRLSPSVSRRSPLMCRSARAPGVELCAEDSGAALLLWAERRRGSHQGFGSNPEQSQDASRHKARPHHAPPRPAPCQFKRQTIRWKKTRTDQFARPREEDVPRRHRRWLLKQNLHSFLFRGPLWSAWYIPSCCVDVIL